MTPARALAAIRQLACLGLPDKSVMPEMIALLLKLVNFETYGLFHTAQNCEVIDALVHPDIPMAILQDCGDNFQNRSDGDGVTGLTLAQRMRHRDIVQPGPNPRVLMHTEFYQRILRPVEMGWMATLPLRNGQEYLAFFVCSRPHALPNFSPCELRLLGAAHPWLCHALARKAGLADNADELTLPAAESALLMLSESGKILSASAGGLYLLYRSAAVPLASPHSIDAMPVNVQLLLARIAQRLARSLHGKTTQPPATIVRNEYGIFHLRAYACEAFTADAPLQMSLHIERHVPIRQRLFSAPVFLSLSARERDVALGMLSGQTQQKIAQNLGIKASSVIHHTSLLYQRMNIQTQKELLAGLLALPSGSTRQRQLAAAGP